MHGTMKVLGREGHTEVTWNSDNAAEVTAARATFDAMRAQGYRAFRTEDGAKAERMDTFDPSAETLVLLPQLQGG